MSYQSTFKRYEKKYLLDRDQVQAIRQALKPHVKEDEYGRYTICNLYFDTPGYDLIRKSIEKPVYKEKLRLRSYGVPGPDDPVYLELKKKYDSEVFKRRVSIPLKDVEPCLTDQQSTHQILDEIYWFQKLYRTEPRVFIAYDRTAFKGALDKHVRITFDFNIRYRQDDLCLSHGDSGMLLLDEGLCLMEIKVHGAMPLWLTHILAEQKIYPRSFSKYGECYKRLFLNDFNEIGGTLYVGQHPDLGYPAAI